MNMIKVHCRTNLDILHFAEKWPEYLPVVPAIGDRIESAHTWKTTDGDRVLQLEVHGVTWKRDRDGNWYAEIEMHLPKHRWETLVKFFEWYGKITGRGKAAFI